ncbi:MAG TPA: ATP-binding cassette domain-containing protein [Candidatus Saccharimonadales bacterium]|nr:ATP-binding cassette domain-containing protein [Candidatus Saccharimonadales bacterium]
MGEYIALLGNVHVAAKDGAQILGGISLQVYRGDRVLVTGPSGSGKSTVLRTLFGVETLRSGEVRLLEKDIHSFASSQRTKLIAEHVGVGFQAPNLDPGFNVWQNIVSLYEGIRRGRPPLDRLAALAVAFGLQNKLKRPVAQLSGGEKQRTALARLLLPQPDLLLLDEPTSMIDSGVAGKAAVYDVLDNMAGPDAALVIVSHDREAERIATRRIVMADGLAAEVMPGQTGQEFPAHIQGYAA